MLAIKPIACGVASRTIVRVDRIRRKPTTICARAGRVTSLKEKTTKRGDRKWQRTYAAVGDVTSGEGNPSSTEAEYDDFQLKAIASKLGKMSKNFRRWGYVGFWVQLALSVVSVVILLFSIAFENQAKGISLSLFLTWLGAILAFISVFWALGYTRLSLRLQKGAEDPKNAISKADTINSCKSGVKLNLFGMFFALLGAQSTVGLLTAKSLTQSMFVSPIVAGSTATGGLVALDIFLLQSCINVIFSHFVGLLVSMLLLNLVTNTVTTRKPEPLAM